MRKRNRSLLTCMLQISMNWQLNIRFQPSKKQVYPKYSVSVLEARNPNQYHWADTQMSAWPCCLWRRWGESRKLSALVAVSIQSVAASLQSSRPASSTLFLLCLHIASSSCVPVFSSSVSYKALVLSFGARLANTG